MKTSLKIILDECVRCNQKFAFDVHHTCPKCGTKHMLISAAKVKLNTRLDYIDITVEVDKK